MSSAAPWLIIVPLLGSACSVAAPRAAKYVGLISASLITITALIVLDQTSDHAIDYPLAGWGADLGIAWRLDFTAAAFIAMTALVGASISAFAAPYFSKSANARWFWPLWLLLWSGLNALFLSGDLFNIYVTLELVGIAAVALAALDGKREAVGAAQRYLVLGLVGSMIYLLGVALIYAGYGSLDIATVASRIQSGGVAWAAVALITIGLIVKAALFPLHFWLPPAHANAAAPVSAALSALVVKAAFYLILRLWFDAFEPIVTSSASMLLGVLGALAVAWGSWQALRTARLKLLAAYSTVAQLGYLFIFLPLLVALPSGEAKHNAAAAVILMALTHGFAKAGLFLAAGFVQKRAGHDNIEGLGPTLSRSPVTVFALALAGVALIGLPPSGSFLAKWNLIGSALETGQWWWIAVVLLGTLLAGAYVFRVLAQAFNQETGAARGFAAAELPALTLALAATVGLGLFSASIWPLLSFAGNGGTP